MNFDRFLEAQEDAHMEREKRDAEQTRDLDDGEAEHANAPAYRVTSVHLPLVVPGWANWLAIDSNGSVWAFEYKPVAGEDCWDLGPEERNYRRAMVAESGWWWIDETSVPDVLSEWSTMLYQVPVNG
jgi:hypothetical protein